MPNTDAKKAKSEKFIARKWVLGGRVQGVGFRPFVYRVAKRCGVQGWVQNRAGEVEVLAQGECELLRSFGRAMMAEAPPLARPEIVSEEQVDLVQARDFQILASDPACSEHIHMPPDYFACDDCLSELGDPGNRRFRYPFINCTQCGPRYSLIERLPYDRANTSMAAFQLCRLCAAEYADPQDRRFHAEPTACPICGPRLEYRRSGNESLYGEDALTATIAALRSGKVVAVKGIGGYHILCDAANSTTVRALRARKGRPDKPFAVMFPLQPGLTDLRSATASNTIFEGMLLGPMRPIVLVPKRAGSRLAPEVAPGCTEIGAMLPYSPLHHLLLKDFGGPLVATSGNISGEPVLTDNTDAEQRLGAVADIFLHHDRPIVRPVDDPIYCMLAGGPRPLRLGRGNAPVEIELPFTLPQPLLALGGHLKNTIALGWGKRVVVSPHLGDMGTPRGLELLQQVVIDMQALYQVPAEVVVCDAHPHYTTTRLARRLGLPVIRTFHHDAHASALAGEIEDKDEWLIFTWDGAGLGRDGTMWGGEALMGRPGRWRRVATLRSFALLGGERAVQEPWRSALALCWEVGTDWPASPLDIELLRHAWQSKLNCPLTSSAGRLFDGAAALLGLVSNASYEGHAPVLLEAACADAADSIPLPLYRNHDGLWQGDWAPLVERLQNTRMSISARAAMFHASLAELLMAQARAVREEYGVARLGLTGGVFQNRILCERVLHLARRDGFTAHIPEKLPCNDAGLSFGQLIEAAAKT